MYCNIFVTMKCNLNCTYCYVDKGSNKNMGRDKIDNIISFINRMLRENNDNLLVINFFGGEPLVGFNFIKELIRNIESMISVKAKFVMTTNGTLLTKEKVDYLKEKRFSLSLSMDGTPKIHNKYRVTKVGEPSWPLIEKNLSYALEQFRNMMARLTFNSVTCESLCESVDFAVNNGFRIIKVVPDYFDQEWSENRFMVLKKQIFMIREHMKLPKYKDVLISLFDNEIKLCGDCEGGRSHFTIDIEGDIYPCTYVINESKFKIGTISEWNSYEKQCYKIKEEERTQCLGCRYYNCCTSKRCLFINYRMTGNFGEPSGFFCEYEKLLFSL